MLGTLEETKKQHRLKVSNEIDKARVELEKPGEAGGSSVSCGRKVKEEEIRLVDLSA